MTEKSGRLITALIAALSIAGCAGPSESPAVAQPAVLPVVPATPIVTSAPATAVPVASAVSASQLPALLDAFQADLVRRLRPEASAGAVSVFRRSDGLPRVSFDVVRAFETDSAQMRPETLLRLAENAAAAQVSGAFVVQVIGYGAVASMPGVESLAERRATAVATYLQGRGLPAARVRAEGRFTHDRELARRLELVFEPIVEGREVRAWMPPPASK